MLLIYVCFFCNSMWDAQSEQQEHSFCLPTTPWNPQGAWALCQPNLESAKITDFVDPLWSTGVPSRSMTEKSDCWNFRSSFLQHHPSPPVATLIPPATSSNLLLKAGLVHFNCLMPAVWGIRVKGFMLTTNLAWIWPPRGSAKCYPRPGICKEFQELGSHS